MTTFLYDLAESTERRWQEVDILITKAQFEKISDTRYYDALCRAIAVLIVAHLESYVRAIADAVIRDINAYSSFRDAPESMKRTFCKPYIDGFMPQGKPLEERVQLLIATFDTLDTKFVVNPFLVRDEQGHERNPSPNVITRVCDNFGVRNIFTWLKSHQIDTVFTNSVSDTRTLINGLRSHILDKTQVYPYEMEINAFSVTEPSGTVQRSRSLYETFLDELLSTRNDVAHGNSFDNNVSIEELIQSRDKVIVLNYTLMLIIGHKLKQLRLLL